MVTERDQLEQDLLYGFVSWLDGNGWSLTNGTSLAEELGDALVGAADDRRNYLPADLMDEEPHA